MIDYTEIKERLRSIAANGLSDGIGTEEMPCIKAAISLAMGLKLRDDPPCVAEPDCTFAIVLNDAEWSSPQARAEALLTLGLASLGTAGTDRAGWVRRVVEGVIRRVLPIALRAAADANPSHAGVLRNVADSCERHGDPLAARHARYAAEDALEDAENYDARECSAYAAAAAELVAYIRKDDYAAIAAANAAIEASKSAGDSALRVAVDVALQAYAAEGRTP